MTVSAAGRPSAHFTPRSGWVNDPLAVTWRDGRYHLFFQHVPESTDWAAHCHWGHAVSDDLLSWQERPVALRPADDEAGCWSGCVVVAPGATPGEHLLLYTSVRDEDLELGRVRVARPRRPEGAGDPWDAWVPGEVVAEPPEGVRAATFRDPVVVPDGLGWRMLVGGGLAAEDGAARGTACVFGFWSEDLATWRYTGLVASRSGAETEPGWTGTKWECPQLVRLGEVDVLVVSVCDEEALHHVIAAPGRFADGRFTAATPWQRLTHGVPYAATAFAARDGRPALLTWLRDVADPAAGWAGALGLPLSVGVEGDRVVLDLLAGPDGLVWEPGPAPLAVRDAHGRVVASLTAEPGAVVLTPSGEGPGLRLPRGRGAVRVVVDGPVLEIVHDGRYGAVPLGAGLVQR